MGEVKDVFKKELEEDFKKVPKRLKDAAKKRREKMVGMDKIVYNLLDDYQFLTIKQIEEIFKQSELEKKGKFKRSFLINSLKRLEKFDLISSRTSNETIHGKLTKFYYKKLPKDYDYTKIIIGEKDYFTFLDQNPTAYAIEDNKIIITSENSKECINEKKFSCPMIVKKENNSSSIILQLPNEFIKFYKLIPGEYYFDPIFSKDKITLIKIRNIKSEDKESISQKLVLILEDNIKYGERMEKRLKQDGHKIILTKTVPQFLEQLKLYHDKIDIVSLDNTIGKQEIAEKISYEIRNYAPQAKIGLLTKNLDKDEEEQFQILNFHYILPKKPSRNKRALAGFRNVLDQLAAWVAAA